MFRNKKFGFYAVTLCLTGLAYTLVCAALETGLTGVVQRFVKSWSGQTTELPTLVGSFLAVPAAFLCGRAVVKSGPRQALLVCAAVAALGCAGLAAAGGIYPLFFVSAAAIRCACALIYICLAVLCAGWSIRYRGRIMGIVTLGAPLMGAVGAGTVTRLISGYLSGDYRPYFLGLAGALMLLALLDRFLLRDLPEEAGLYPGGAGRPPLSEPEDEQPPLTPKQICKDGRAWLLFVICGALAAVAAGCMGGMGARFLALGGEELWLSASRWLALGAILSIPASYIFGVIDDCAGSAVAVILLAAMELLCALALLMTPAAGSPLWGVALCAGGACLLGGPSTVIPCAIGRVYGRRQFAAAGAILLPAVLLPAAAAPVVTVQLIQAGLGRTACMALVGLAAIGLAAALLLIPIRDANAPDRGRDNKT